MRLTTVSQGDSRHSQGLLSLRKMGVSASREDYGVAGALNAQQTRESS